MSDASEEEEEAAVVSSMRSIAGGASIFFIGKMVSNGAGFFTNLLLTRGLGPQLYGIYAYTSTLGFIALAISNLGSTSAVLKYVPQYEDQPPRRSAMLFLAYLTSAVASIIIAVGLFVGAPLLNSITLSNPLFVNVLRIYAFIIPFNTLSNLIGAIFKSYEDMIASALVSSVVEPVLKFIGVGTAILLGYELFGVVAAIVAAGLLTTVFGAWLIYRRVDDTFVRTNPASHAAEFYSFSLPLSLASVANTLFDRIDILMVGYFLSSAAVGIYNLASILTLLLTLPLMAFKQLYPPIASRLYHNGQLSDLNEIYATTNRWVFTITLFPFLVMLLFSDQILLIFGSDFTAGTEVLMVLAAAQLINATAGPSGFTLSMTDHQYLSMATSISMIVLNVILNYLLILEFGVVGAAVATGGCIVLLNILRVSLLWYIEGLFPYSRQYYKPLFVGLSSVLGMGLFTFMTDFHYLITLIIGSGFGGLLYVSTLYILGFEDAEIELMREFLG